MPPKSSSSGLSAAFACGFGSVSCLTATFLPEQKEHHRVWMNRHMYSWYDLKQSRRSQECDLPPISSLGGVSEVSVCWFGWISFLTATFLPEQKDHERKQDQSVKEKNNSCYLRQDHLQSSQPSAFDMEPTFPVGVFAGDLPTHVWRKNMKELSN